MNRTPVAERLPAAVRAAPPACTLRVAGPGDCDLIRAFVAGLSVRSRYLRFFTTIGPTSPSLLSVLCGARGRADVLVVTDAGGGVIAHGMAVDADGPAGSLVSDIGLVVADRWQQRGLGRMLLNTLTARAAARGVCTLVLDVLPENSRMLGMIARRWPDAARERTADSIVVRARIDAPRRPASAVASLPATVGWPRAGRASASPLASARLAHRCRDKEGMRHASGRTAG
jgi:GNAT superfamily N-acetyltransferase